MAIPASSDHPASGAPSIWLTLLLAVACGAVVGNVYYAQPLAGPISADLGLPPSLAGLIVTMTQLGYGAGLLLIVPAGDLVENRRLIVVMILASGVALLAAGMAIDGTMFLLASLAIGLGSVAVQVMVPYAAHMSPERLRGQTVGQVMSGLMFGIMLARPFASLMADLVSWRSVFLLAAGAMIVLAVIIGLHLPPRRPPPGLNYGALLRSMGSIALTSRVLQRRAFYHACLFAAFSIFWTTTPLLLAGPFGLSQSGIALFALAGASGALAAPIVGRLADRGHGEALTVVAMIAAATAFAITHLAPEGSMAALALLVVAAIILDAGVTMNMVTSQRAIFALDAAFQSRLNGLYMASFFIAGAAGSAYGGWAYAEGGWFLTSWTAMILPAIGLSAAFVRRPKRPSRDPDQS